MHSSLKESRTFKDGSGSHFTGSRHSKVKVSINTTSWHFPMSTGGDLSPSTETGSLKMVFECLWPYLSSSIPCFKTPNLPALERARSSLCMVLKASVLREAFLDLPTLIDFFFFFFARSTLTVKKSRERTCSQSAFIFPTRHVFQTPSAVATAGRLGCHQPLCQAGSRATCPREAGDGTKKRGSISFTDIARTVKTRVQMGKGGKAIELKGLLSCWVFSPLNKLSEKSKDSSLHNLTCL